MTDVPYKNLHTLVGRRIQHRQGDKVFDVVIRPSNKSLAGTLICSECAFLNLDKCPKFTQPGHGLDCVKYGIIFVAAELVDPREIRK